jgi:hypothetical protein
MKLSKEYILKKLRENDIYPDNIFIMDNYIQINITYDNITNFSYFSLLDIVSLDLIIKTIKNEI